MAIKFTLEMYTNMHYPDLDILKEYRKHRKDLSSKGIICMDFGSYVKEHLPETNLIDEYEEFKGGL